MATFFVAVVLVALQLASISAEPIREQGAMAYEYKPVRMPSKCRGKDYCTFKGNNYPEDIMKKLAPNLSKLVLKLETTHIEHRYGENDNECESITRNRTVYYIRDRYNLVRVVVQIEKVFEQIFGETKCVNPGPINYDTLHLGSKQAIDFDMYCKEILRQDMFYVLNSDFSGIEKSEIRSGIPVYCACRYDNSSYIKQRF